MTVESNYQRVLMEVEKTAIECGRDPSEVTLITVSKGHSWGEVSGAYQAGCVDFGENRVQEALIKIQEAPSAVNWHFIGPLQRNKIRKMIGKFALIHSVDSLELAQKISTVAQELNVDTSILLEVNTSEEASKHGFTEEECLHAFEKLLQLPFLKIQGLMTMAPFIEDQTVIRDCFARLRQLKEKLEIQATMPHLSMGMSHDYRLAIQEGATLLRVGRAITVVD
jgi:PLP dependent protein